MWLLSDEEALSESIRFNLRRGFFAGEIGLIYVRCSLCLWPLLCVLRSGKDKAISTLAESKWQFSFRTKSYQPE